MIGADVKLFFDAEIDDETVGPGPGGQEGPWVVGGQEWQIVGTMENRTPDETIEIGVLPLLTGNAHYAVPIPENSVPPDEECGIGVLRQLGPGEEIEFAAPVRTVLDGGTRGTVGYDPTGAVVEDDGTKTALDRGRDPRRDRRRRAHVVSVDTRDRVPESSAGEVIWTYGTATIETFADLAGGMGLMAIQATAFLLQPWEWLPAFRTASDKTAEYVYEVHENLSPADREDWLNSWASRGGVVDRYGARRRACGRRRARLGVVHRAERRRGRRATTRPSRMVGATDGRGARHRVPGAERGVRRVQADRPKHSVGAAAPSRRRRRS